MGIIILPAYSGIFLDKHPTTKKAVQVMHNTQPTISLAGESNFRISILLVQLLFGFAEKGAHDIRAFGHAAP